jgi:hypothetical protein
MFRSKLDDLRRIRPEVTVSKPCRSNSDVNQPAPTEAAGAIRVYTVVNGFQMLEFGARGFVGDTLVLNGAVIAGTRAADNKRQVWIPP